jgi:hypothetical protein
VNDAEAAFGARAETLALLVPTSEPPAIASIVPSTDG